jgi:hypothetical protein
MTTVHDQGGIGSRRRIAGIRRGSQVAGTTQTKREAISTSESATASPASSQGPGPSSRSRIALSCSPIRMKTRLLSTNSTKSHTARAARRVRDEKAACCARPITRPVVTTAMTPERCSASAARKLA